MKPLVDLPVEREFVPRSITIYDAPVPVEFESRDYTVLRVGRASATLVPEAGQGTDPE